MGNNREVTQDNMVAPFWLF